MKQGGPFYAPESDVARQIVALDWTHHPLGPIETWPKTLLVTAGVMLRSPFPMAIVWGEHKTTLYNDAFLPILGDKPGTLGQSFADIWEEAWGEIGPVAERAYAGEATFIEDFPLRINRYGYDELAYFTFSYSPIHDETGDVQGFIDTVIETTGKVEANRQAAILNGELAHRIKNTLTIVQSIISQTLRNVSDPATVRTLLNQRLQTLAQAHSLLTGGSRGDAPIRTVVENALLPHVTDMSRVTISGPALYLGEKPALALALAVNELATNALKYGALSNDAGRIDVVWHDSGKGEDAFCLRWRESGGPAVEKPSRQGFGSRLLKDVVAYDFGGKVAHAYERDGVFYEIICDSRNLRPDIAGSDNVSDYPPVNR